MKRLVIAMMTAGAVYALTWSAPASITVRAQAGPATATKTTAGGAVPRMADGHPDLSGVWWGGGDVGAASGRGPVGRGARGGPPPQTFQSLYTPEAAQKAKTLGDKDDPTLRCTPTAFGTLNVSLWDVGAVGQIVATPKMVVMLTETYHGFRLVPTDGRPHRDDVAPSYRGDSVGRWDGDTFVVDTTNFRDGGWLDVNGSPMTEAGRMTERFRRPNYGTLTIDITVDDPKAYTRPWSVSLTQRLMVDSEMLEFICLENEQSSKHYVAI